MIAETFQNTLENIWPLLIIISVIVISTRIAYIILNHKKLILYKELIHLLFIIYILCLFHIVTYQDISYGNNFIPFKEMFRYDIGTSGFMKSVLGNIILFIPFGLFISYVLKCKKIFTPFILTLIVSFTIECVQYHIGRVFDIDDIILNVIGGITGYLLYIGADAIHNRLPKFMKRDWFLNLIVIILILIAIIYGFNGDILEKWLCLN